MSKWLKGSLIVLGLIPGVALVALVLVARAQALDLVYYPPEEREPILETPADYGLPYEEVSVTTTDGLKLVSWYIPSENGAAIIAQHGFKGAGRQDLLLEAEFLHRHGCGVLLTTFRAHDRSDGEMFTFGRDEMRDFEAWYQYLLSRDDVDPDRIGILAESMGAALSLKYTAQNPNIKAVVAHSSFSAFEDTVEIAVRYFTGLPPFPFAPLIIFWAEREVGIDTAEIDATMWIQEISPRPVFILQGGKDDHISTQSGQWLYDAAGEPKELWYEPEAVHHGFDEEPFVAEFERRVVAFFDQYLLEEGR